MLTLDEILAHDDPYPHVLELAASGDRSLIVPVRAALQPLAEAEDWYRAGLMARILVGVEGAAAVPWLLGLLGPALEGFEDPEPFQLSVGRALHEDPEGCRPAVLAAVASPGPHLRRAGLWALGSIVGPDDLGLMREAMSDPDPSMRREAFSGLTSDVALREIVVEALHDPDEWIRREAVIRLGWSGSPDAFDLLIPLVADPSRVVRGVLGEAIGRLAGQTIDPLTHERAAEAVRRVLADTVPIARVRLARNLGLLRRSGSLLAALSEDPDPEIRDIARQALEER
ncbi:HEAT repeat domain-containing protein [Actinoplanes sp. NPDC000266]